MKIEAQVGQVILSAGSEAQPRMDRTAALVVAQAHGRYHEAVLQGNVFIGSNTAVQALSLNSTTATGLILTNPPGSGKLLSLLEICVAVASLPAGQCSIILTGTAAPTTTAVTHTTPLVSRNAFIGGASNSAGLVDSAATIPASNILRVVGAGAAATVAASTAFPPFIRDEISGLLLLQPGTCISLQALTTSVSVLASITWEELPYLNA